MLVAGCFRCLLPATVKGSDCEAGAAMEVAAQAHWPGPWPWGVRPSGECWNGSGRRAVTGGSAPLIVQTVKKEEEIKV